MTAAPGATPTRRSRRTRGTVGALTVGFVAMAATATASPGLAVDTTIPDNPTPEEAASPSSVPRPTVPADPVEAADPSIFDYEQVRPTAFTETGEVPFRGIDFTLIEFDSPAGGTATAWLVRPDVDPVDGVGLIWGHPAPVDGRDSFSPMSVFACAGVTQIVVNAPYSRTSERRGQAEFRFTAEDRDEQIQLVVDMRRAIDILLDRGAERIGFGGISYGSAIGGQLIGVDDRVEAALLLLGSGGVVEMFTDESGAPSWPDLGRLTDQQVEEWFEIMLPIEPGRFIGASNADILFMNGTRDPLVTPMDAVRFQAAARQPSQVYWMDVEHDISFEDFRYHNRWLGEQFGLDLDRLDACLDQIYPDGF